ncbi:MAG: glycosyltransferase [Weeksellaceae bacterium]
MLKQKAIKELLIVVEHMNLGGTEKSLLAFLNEIKDRRDLKIKLLLIKPGGELYDKIPEGIEVEILKDYFEFKKQTEEISTNGITGLIKNLKIFRVFKALYFYLKIKLTQKWYFLYEYPDVELQKFKTDLAIAFSGPQYFITWFTIHNISANKKIQWIHFDVSKIKAEYDFGELYYPKFDRIYCVSKSAFDAFVKRYPGAEKKAAVFENIVSESEITKLAEEGKSFSDDFKGLRILTVGRLSKEKGQLMIPEVVRRLKNEGLNFRWYLIGDGSQKSQIESEIKKLGIENELILTGSQINPYPFFKDCELYVQTSFEEGYGLTLHEAKIFEKPVISTNFPSAYEILTENEDGLLVKMNPDEIYKAVSDLIKNEKKRNRLEKFCKKESAIKEIEF